MLRPAIALIVVVLTFVGVAHGQPVQATARDPKPSKTPTAVIKGRVLAAESGAPLRRARLTLSGATLERARYAATDAQGRYEFTDLPAGRYTLKASKTAYVTLEYGQRRAFEAGKPIEISDGVTLEKTDFTLPRGAVISGTVVDDGGEPVALARVAAMRSTFEQGKRKLIAVGPDVETNDRGEYRLFGLQPGSYYVAAGTMPGPDGHRFAPSYYPGTLNAAEAQRVVVRLGQERGGVDLAMLEGRLARVSGTVVETSGRPLTGAWVSIVSPSRGYSLTASVKADRSFVLQNIAPGDYLLAVERHGATPGDIEQTGVPITVEGDEIVGLTLQLNAGCRLRGRIVTEDGAPPPFPPSDIRVHPTPIPSVVPFTIRNIGAQGIVKDDWSFEMDGIGGTMLFRPAGLPAGYTLKSVLLDGRDLTDEPFDIKGTADVAGLQVVITSQITEITGVPSDAKGHPADEYAVVVFADDAARWKYPSRFIATARPDQQGRFKISSLPPGRYLAVAVEYLEQGQWQDPEFLEALRPLATMFILTAGEKKTLDLKVVRPE